jgi:enoyl-CoA hydratase
MSPDALARCDDMDRPLALIDLALCPPDAPFGALPPYPVIGIGDARHPIAARLDAVIEPPVSVRQLVANIERAPLAAACLVQLLRGIETLDVERALTLESMSLAMLQGSAEHTAWLAAQRPPLAAASGKVDLERCGDRLLVTLDRPSALNAIDRAMRDDLHAAFTVATLDPDVGTIVLRSMGTAFSVGADLAEFGTTRDPATAHDIRMRTLPARALARFAGRIDAHVQGACIGAGLELVAFATRLTACRSAWFQLPELTMGIIPGAGGCVSVMRRIGRHRAALMILSGRRIGAETALRWGLIDAIVDAPAVDEDGAHQIG